MGSSPDTPKEDPETKLLRRRQAQQLAQLDEEQNTRLKRMFSAANGLRVFRGAPAGRLPGMNSTRGAEPSNYGLVQSDARGMRSSNLPRRPSKTKNSRRGGS